MRILVAALAAACCGIAIAAVDVNDAPLADIEQIPGIGVALAERIVDERGKRPFADWADLIARVKGAGRAHAERWSRAGLTVGGAPYGAASAPGK
jgi:competence protein ComEA